MIGRRTSGGTDGEAGSRFVERMLSVVATCRQQGTDVLEFLTRCHRARLNGESATSLDSTVPSITGGGLARLPVVRSGSWNSSWLRRSC